MLMYKRSVAYRSSMKTPFNTNIFVLIPRRKWCLTNSLISGNISFLLADSDLIQLNSVPICDPHRVLCTSHCIVRF